MAAVRAVPRLSGSGCRTAFAWRPVGLLQTPVPRLDDVRGSRGDPGDQRLGIPRPPAGGGLLDGIRIRDQLRAAAEESSDVLGGLLFRLLTVVVRGQELWIGGDQGSRGWRSPGRAAPPAAGMPRPGRLDVVDQLSAYLVGTVHAKAAPVSTHPAPPPQRRRAPGSASPAPSMPTAVGVSPRCSSAGPFHPQHRDVVSDAAVDWARLFRPALDERVDELSAPGSVASDRATSGRPSLAEALFAVPEWPSKSPSVSSNRPWPSGGSNSAAATAEHHAQRGPGGRLQPPHRAGPVQQHPG